MTTSEYEFEPVRGLPEHLPKGEHILWQGSPDPWALARRAFHVRQIAVYFALLLGWYAVSRYGDGHGAAAVAVSALPLIGVSLLCLAMLGLLGWLSARSSIYTITNHRIVLRIGIALTMAINIPFRQIAAANLKTYRDGSGDVTLKLLDDNRIAYLHLWPHARAWRLTRPEPMLRAIPHVESVAKVLSDALSASLDENAGRLGKTAPPRRSRRAAAPRPAAVAAE